MINLLPTKHKKLVRKEILRRLIVVLGGGLLTLMMIEILLSFSLFFYTDFLAEGLSDQLTSSEELAELKEIEELESRAKKMNDFFINFQNKQKEKGMISEGVSEILNILPPSIKINSFFFEEREKDISYLTVVIKGVAATRNDLLAFVEGLKSEDSFGDVLLPVSNLLTERDVDFSVTINFR